MPDITIADKQMIEQLFDETATKYDRAGPNIFAQFGARLVDRTLVTRGARVLDVATGTGSVLLHAVQCVGPKGHVVGIDLSSEMIREAKSAVDKIGLKNIELHKMDAEQLEFPDQSFDFVTCAFSIFLFPDIEAVIGEMYRVCRPGGAIGVSFFNNTPIPFSPGFPVLAQQLMECQSIVMLPQSLSFSPGEIEALLSRFDFNSIKTHSEINEIIYTNLEDWWDFWMTIGPRWTISGMSEETRAEFKEQHFANLQSLLSQDGLHASVGVVYAVAMR